MVLAISIAAVAILLALGVLVMLVVGTRSAQFDEAPRTCVEAITRRLLGVSVRNKNSDRYEHERS
jgi:hypothetical protein